MRAVERGVPMMRQDDREASVFFEFVRQVSVDVSVDHVIEAALDGIMRVMDPDIGLFFLRQGEELVVRGVRPEADELADLGSEVKVVGECLCGVAAQGKPVYAGDIHADPRCLFPQWAADPGLWLKQLHPEDRVRVQSEFSLTHREASPFMSEYRMIAADGSTVWIRDEATVVVDESGRSCCLQGVMLDITERKKLEAQLLQAQKMEAVGHLAGGIAHDFNNILTAIIGYASLMKLHMTEDDPLQANAEQILSAADKATSLIRSLLAYSRKQLIEPKPVNLTDVVVHLRKLLVRVIGEDITLSTNLAKGALVVLADRGQLEQIIMNLTANARDAMPHGGNLVIGTQEVFLDEEFVRIVGYGKPGRHALLSFADTGAGMDEKTIERIFEPFFTTKEPGKGTGLGLAMVYGAVKQHQGIIMVQSEPDKGTAFKIYLPLSEVGAESSESAEPVRQVSGKETILVAEDDAALRTLAKETLSRFGYRVIEAADGEEAVRVFGEHADAIDLLLVDVIMPKLNGREVYEAAKVVKPDVKAIFTSGYSRDLMHERGVLREGIHYLHKPFTPNMLLRRLREALESSLTP
jgi:signal transduction histidine kinase/ActR/RegA family two-component response regulator